MDQMSTNGQALNWIGLVARAAATALGVGLTLMMLVALTTSLAIAAPSETTAGWTWVSGIVTLSLLLGVTVFGAAVLNHACRLFETKGP